MPASVHLAERQTRAPTKRLSSLFLTLIDFLDPLADEYYDGGLPEPAPHLPGSGSVLRKEPGRRLARLLQGDPA